MVKGEVPTVLEAKFKSLDPDQKEGNNLFGCKQADKIDVKLVIDWGKIRICLEMDQFNKNVINAINCRVIPVAGYVKNECDLRKSDLEDLHKIAKSTLRYKICHGRQSSDEKLHSKR